MILTTSVMQSLLCVVKGPRHRKEDNTNRELSPQSTRKLGLLC